MKIVRCETPEAAFQFRFEGVVTVLKSRVSEGEGKKGRMVWQDCIHGSI
jgi:hypothetical protein